MANEFAIKGLGDAMKKLRTLGPKLQKKGLGVALRKGAAIVRKDAVNRAKVFDRTGTPNKIFKEIVTRTNAKRGRQVGGVVVQVGVKGGAKQYVDNRKNRRAGRVGGSYEGPGSVFYWRFLEFGTSKMAARPFMRPALENNQQRVTDTVVASLNTEIDKLVAKGGR